MKRTMKYIWTIVMALLLVFGASGCGELTPTGESGATGASDVTISEPVFGFISEEEYDPSTSVIDTSKKWTALDVDTSYYLFLSFTITAARNNDGQSLLDLNITFDSLNVMDGTIEDVNTGMVESMIFKDATTGNVGKTTTASFKIPALSTEPKIIEMIVKLRPVDVGESHIIIGYDYDQGGEYKILGSDGYTKNLKINEVQIEAPTLSVTDMGLLSWTHVKNAEYYLVYENGNEVIDALTGEKIVIWSEGYAVGSEIQYSIGNYIVGFHNLSIRAFSSNNNILTSDYSNTVSHMW